jgi:large subunit ribosomal protein L21
VVGTVLEQDRDKKVLVFKKKRRKQYRRTHGHRQAFTSVAIEKIEGKR